MVQDYLIFFLIFLVVLDVLFYIYTALTNNREVKILFLGDEKKKNLRNLIFICLIDGIIIGVIIDRFLLR